MTGSDAAEGAAGYAVFPRDGTGYIVLMGLLPAPDDHVWQAWMLDDEHAASAGLMSVDTDGLAMLEGVEPMPGMALVAVTMEPAGGSPGPTTTPVVVGQLDAPLAGEGDGSLALMR
jgi:anti-sigma-K factor RskA